MAKVKEDWVVVSNIFYFHPYLGKWSNLTNIFQMGWNHQLEDGFQQILVEQVPPKLSVKPKIFLVQKECLLGRTKCFGFQSILKTIEDYTPEN